jgi:hypothetical protein
MRILFKTKLLKTPVNLLFCSVIGSKLSILSLILFMLFCVNKASEKIIIKNLIYILVDL